MRVRHLRPASLSLCFTALMVIWAACGSDDPADDGDNVDNTTSGQPGSSGQGGDGATGAGPSSSGEGGSGASTTSSTSGNGGGCVGLGDACSDCAVESCNALYCTCAANSACTTLISCLDGCGSDQNCSQGCLSATPAGIADAVLLNDCANGSCGSQCPTTQPLDACQKCAAQNCPTQLSACLANPECTPLIECASNCSEDDFFCLSGCADDYGGGQDVAEDLGGCVEGPCNGLCG
jgi:hypothetical protein